MTVRPAVDRTDGFDYDALDRAYEDVAAWLGLSRVEYSSGLADGTVASLIASEAVARGYEIP